MGGDGIDDPGEEAPVSYLLRVVLPDRPGALGLLALALGEVDGDILSLDVVERGPGYAVDDLVVSLPTGTMPDVLVTAAESVADTRVDTVRPHTGLLHAHRELELLDTVSAAPRPRRLAVLADGLPRALQAHWAAILSTDTGTLRPLAASPGAPQTWPADPPGTEITAATALDQEAAWVPQVWRDGDTALVAAPLGPGRLLLVGRGGGPEFRPGEVARIGYLAGIAGHLLGPSGRPRTDTGAAH